MKQLGVNVLKKIESLITQIDKKPKENNNIKNKTQLSIDEEKKTFEEIFRKKSYIFLQKRQKIEKQKKEIIYNNAKEYQHFKVNNKKSIQILNKSQTKPIQDRIEDIVRAKQDRVNKMKNEIQKIEKSKLNRYYDGQQSTSEKKYVKMSKNDIQRLVNQREARNKQILQRKHLRQLSRVKYQQYLCIPCVNKSSVQLSTHRNKKNKYSDNVFERMDQQKHNYDAKLNELMEKTYEKEGGFQPVLCHKSRLIADKNKIKRSLTNKTLNSDIHNKHCEYGKKYKFQDKLLQSQNTKTNRSFKLNKQNGLKRMNTEIKKDNSQSISNQQKMLQTKKQNNVNKSRNKNNKSMNSLINSKTKKKQLKI